MAKAISYRYRVLLEGTGGFILNTDVLDVGQLGYFYEDLTNYVRSADFKQSRSSSQGKFSAGQLSIVFDNRDRRFDPNYADSPLYGAIVPRRTISFNIETLYDNGGQTTAGIFKGIIDSWSFDYDVNTDSTATAQCSDLFGVFSKQNITLTNPPAELSGDRMVRVLNQAGVAFTGQVAYQAAVFTLGTASYSGNALEYLQQIADSEQGYLYATPGRINLLGWNFFSNTSNPIVFSDTGGSAEIPFVALSTTYDTDEFYNYVTVSGAAGTVVAQNLTSQNNYEISAYDLEVLQSGTAEMGTVATYIASAFGEPRFRISDVTVSLDSQAVKDLPSGYYDALALEIGTYASIRWTPNGVGSAVTQSGWIVGKSVSARPGSCSITYSFSGPELRSFY